MNKILLTIAGGVLLWSGIILLVRHMKNRAASAASWATTSVPVRQPNAAEEHAEEKAPTPIPAPRSLAEKTPESFVLAPGSSPKARNKEVTLPPPYEELWGKAAQAEISHYPTSGTAEVTADLKDPVIADARIHSVSMPMPGGIFSSRIETEKPHTPSTYAISLPIRDAVPEPGGMFSSSADPGVSKKLSVLPTANLDSPAEPGGRFSSKLERAASPTPQEDNKTSVSAVPPEPAAPAPGGAFPAPGEQAKKAATAAQAPVTPAPGSAPPASAEQPKKAPATVDAGKKGQSAGASGKKLYRVITVTGEEMIAKSLMKDELFVTIYQLKGPIVREALINIKSITPFTPEE